MVTWIIEPPTQVFEVRKVTPEQSRLNVFYLLESKERIGQLILSETNIETALKLEAIYKSMNEAINKSL